MKFGPYGSSDDIASPTHLAAARFREAAAPVMVFHQPRTGLITVAEWNLVL